MTLDSLHMNIDNIYNHDRLPVVEMTRENAHTRFDSEKDPGKVTRDGFEFFSDVVKYIEDEC